MNTPVNADPDVAVIDLKFRRKTLLSSESLLRNLRTAVECYGEDLESFVIYLSVAIASTSGAMRDPARTARLKPGNTFPDSYHRPVSRRAIAAATGLPRETVRRKIAQLLEQGHLIEDGRGVRTRGGVIAERRNLEFLTAMIHEMERSTQELARIESCKPDPA